MNGDVEARTGNGKTIVILGGGIGGLVAANELRRRLDKKHRIILIDRNDQHIYTPSFLWLMLGKRQAHSLQKPLHLLNRKGIDFIHQEVTGIDQEQRVVRAAEKEFKYDYLVISLGADLAAEKVPGLAQGGYNLYKLQEVERLRDDLKDFSGDRKSVV